VPSNARLGPLPHLYFDGGGLFQIARVNAEPARGDLHDCPGPEWIQLLMQTALAAIPESAGGLGGAGEDAMHIEVHRAERHGSKDNGSIESELRRPERPQPQGRIQVQFATRALADPQRRWLAAQVRYDLHWLAKGVNGWVGDLARVEQ
jgi:hypothetical protein